MTLPPMDPLRAHKALADETRLRLAYVLRAAEMNVGELVTVFGMGQSRVSRHLKILAEAGLVDCRREGQWTLCRATTAEENPAAHAFLEATCALLEGSEPYAGDVDRAQAQLSERAAATRRFFDTVAGDWESLSADVLGGFDIDAELVRRVPEGATVADLGCGTGGLMERLAQRACLVIGVDNAPAMLELARDRFRGTEAESRISLRHGELTQLPLREAEAQAVVLCLVLHHLPDPVAALAEARRVLAPGGVLLVADFDRHDHEFMRKDHGDMRLGVDRQTLISWLGQAGFIPASIQAYPVNQGLTVLLAEAARAERGAPKTSWRI